MPRKGPLALLVPLCRVLLLVLAVRAVTAPLSLALSLMLHAAASRGSA